MWSAGLWHLPRETAAVGPAAPPPSVCDEEPGLTLRSRWKRPEQEAWIYDGQVEIAAGTLRIACPHAQRDAGRGGGLSLRGTGGATIRGVRGFEQITAERFHLRGDRGELRLAGSVRLTGSLGTEKYRLATVTLTGRVSDTRTLLEDFSDSEDIHRRLALLDGITAVYDDAELPPEAAYLLAMKLLEATSNMACAHGAGRGRRFRR